MSCCCCSAEEAGISLAGIAFVVLVAFVAINLAAILHFLLMVLLGTLAVGTVITAIGAGIAWRLHVIGNARTVRYSVERVSDDDVLEGEVVTGGIDGRARQAVEGSRTGSIWYGGTEQPDGTVIPQRFWLDGSPVRPIRHSQR